MLKTITAAISMVMLLAVTSACTDQTTEEPVFFLVRHAEKQGGSDPSLTEAGAARAERLAAQLEKAGIEAVYATDTKRAQETGAPLAEALGLEIISYDPFDLDGFAADLKAAGQTALVVGHSNTTPNLAEKLGGESHGLISDDDYDRLYCLEGDRTVLMQAGGTPLTGPGCP